MAFAVKDTQNKDHIIREVKTMDDRVRTNRAYANALAKLGTRRAARWEAGNLIIKFVTNVAGSGCVSGPES